MVWLSSYKEGALYVSTNTIEILIAVDRYKKHINGVYELETFYGDETSVPFDHTGELSTFLSECENAYGLTESEYENYVQSIEESAAKWADSFTKEHEEASVKYALSKSKEKKKTICRLINPAFNEMVDKIVYTTNSQTFQTLTTSKQSAKFGSYYFRQVRPCQGFKAFSYFSEHSKLVHPQSQNSLAES